MSKSGYGLKIFSAEQVRRWDEYTVLHEPIASEILMERAAHAFVKEFTQLFSTKFPITIFCGLGNNGGDGLAISRLLLNSNYRVNAFVLRYEGRSTKDFRFHLQKLEKVMQVDYISSDQDFPLLSSDMVVIDAIFGSGLNRPITGLTKQVVQMINEVRCPVVSVDIASGLFASTPVLGNVIVRPTYTFTFQHPKLSFFFPQNEMFTGEMHILDIGLNPGFSEIEPSDLVYLQKEDMAKLLKRRNKFDHKGKFGHVLLYAGSRGKMGAALLASQAALKTGCGLLSVLVEEHELPIIQNGIWEAMCIPFQAQDEPIQIPSEGSFTLGIGPGIGKSDLAKSILEQFLKLAQKPMLLDADALNLLAEYPQLLNKLPSFSILTPHPKEFERLVGRWEDEYERLEKQKQFSSYYNVYVVLKGAYTSISTPSGAVFFNSTGNPGMATGGSGDVLSGIIVSLLTQHYEPEVATLLGVFLHGLAGDLAAEEVGENSLLASDIVRKIPAAFMSMQSHA